LLSVTRDLFFHQNVLEKSPEAGHNVLLRALHPVIERHDQDGPSVSLIYHLLDVVACIPRLLLLFPAMATIVPRICVFVFNDTIQE
jgi:hypothetical protein